MHRRTYTSGYGDNYLGEWDMRTIAIVALLIVLSPVYAGEYQTCVMVGTIQTCITTGSSDYVNK